MLLEIGAFTTSSSNEIRYRRYDRGFINPLFTVLSDYRAQYANYEQRRIEGEAGRGHAHV